MRLIGLAVAGLLVFAACGGSSQPRQTSDIFELRLNGTATARGKLALSAPERIEVDVAEGTTALDLLLALRQQLQARRHEVVCTIDRGGQGFALLVQGRVEISDQSSNLGGIAGTAGQVVQRREVVESSVREYLRALRENSRDGLRRTVTDSFFDTAARDLGQATTLVSLADPSVGCNTASAVVEVESPGGQHTQRELRLVTDDGQFWKVEGAQTLASWTQRDQGRR